MLNAIARAGMIGLLVFGFCSKGYGQTNIIPFTSGAIPPCDTSTFTANVSGIGTLYPPGSGWWQFSLTGLLINITTTHPETMSISLTSPEGTTLLLSAFNGAGGQNYTNTNFINGGWQNITTGAAPFNGYWIPEGGQLDVFDYENADGIWTITVIDTACSNNGPGPGGTWSPGWFDGSSNNGGFAIAFNGPPPCWGGIPSMTDYICPGESVDIFGFYIGSGYSITVSDWNGGPPDPSAVTTPGTYYVEAYDMWQGCVYGATYDLIASPQITLGPDQVVNTCAGSPPSNLYVLFDVTGASTTDWWLDGSPIAVNASFSATIPGTYQVVATNAGACNDTAYAVLVVANDQFLGPDQAASVCQGGITDVAALIVAPGITPTWTFNGSPIAAPTAVDVAGLYTASYTSPLGCTDQVEVTLAVEPLPTLGADQAVDLCDNATIDLDALYTTSGFVPTWTIAGALVTDPTAASGAGTYSLVVTSASGCADTANVVVNGITSPMLGGDMAAQVCSGSTVDLNSYFTTTGLSTAWTNAGNNVPDATTVGTPGMYTLIATHVNMCSDTAEVNLALAITPALGNDQSIAACDGEVVNLTALYNGGTNTLAWTITGAPVADATAITTAGNYTVTATSAAGCSDDAMVTLSFDPSPALGSDQTAAICAGAAFDLTALYTTTGLAPTWSVGGSALADPTAVNTAGNYQLVVTNNFGCADDALVSLAVNANPALGADQFFTLCPWQTVDLGTVFPIDGMNATYLINGIAVDDPTTVADTGIYSITVIDANGCTDAVMATVLAMECLCEADFSHDVRCMQDPAQFTLLADSAIVSANWDFGGGATNTVLVDPLVQWQTEGSMVVTLQATLTCGVVQVQRTIEVVDCTDSCSVWIPNAFTPDSDDRNDAWTWNGECMPEDFSMLIFNRWGELIFSSQDPQQKWDGTYQGAVSQDGVYVYRMGYRLPYQKHKEVVGHVTLLR